MSVSYETEGVYYPTITVTDDQGMTYADTIAIVVINQTDLDALLQAKWNAMKTALGNQDVEGAVVYFTENSKDMFRYNFELMQSILPTIVQDMESITMQKGKDGLVVYEMFKLQDGTERSYYIEFIKDTNGI